MKLCLPDLVRRLSHQSVVKHFDAYADIPWDDADYQVSPDDPRWEPSLHFNAGNMVMADGSAQQLSQSGLVKAMASSGDTRNCGLKPN